MSRRPPAVVNRNGKPAAVMLSPAALSGHGNFVAAVDDGLADLDEGRVITDDEVDRLLDERFGALPKPKGTRR